MGSVGGRCFYIFWLGGGGEVWGCFFGGFGVLEV